MIEYKNDLRIRVNAHRGTVKELDLDLAPGCEDELDKEIIACAGNYLSTQQLKAFVLAYHCQNNTWEKIQMKFYSKREVQIDTIQRYTREAAKSIADHFKPKAMSRK